jgi:hypothetical protein
MSGLISWKDGAAFAALLFLCACAAQSNFPRIDRRCTRVALDTKPRWSFSAIWHQEEDELVVVDVVGGRLLRYDRSGKRVGSIVNPGSGELEIQRPQWLVKAGAETILIHELRNIIGLDQTLKPVWGKRLDPRDATQAHVTWFGQPVVFDGALISPMRIGFGHDAWLGYARIELGGDFAPQKLTALPAESSEEGERYKFAGPLVAAAAGGVYVLRFEPEPRLQRVLPAPRDLSAIPAGFGPPLMPPVSGPGDMEGADALVRQSTTISGVWGQGKFLYLLTREPGSGTGTKWLLHQIDPVEDELLRQLQLPTLSNSLIVVPGEKLWAFIEKGPVTGVSPVQDIGSVVMIPASVISGEDRGSPAMLECSTGPAE